MHQGYPGRTASHILTICIPTVRPDTLGATVASIQRQTCTDWKLLILGQGNDPRLHALAQQFTTADSRIRYQHVAPRGVSRARNAALRAADTPWIIFIDDDCEAREDWLATYVSYFQRWPDIMLIGGSVIAPPKPRWKIGMCPQTIPQEAIYDPAVTPLQPPPGFEWFTANVAIRRSLVEQIGYFDELLGVGGHFRAGEDYDYKVRIELRGLKMASTPAIVVYHTYGYRYGLRAAANHARDYAIGDGAVVAKLMMLDPTRGAHELALRRESLRRDLLKPARLPKRLWRQYHFWRTYRQCMRAYRLDPEQFVLRPVKAPAAS